MSKRNSLNISTASFDKPGSILLESQLSDTENKCSYYLTDPIEIYECYRPEEVSETLGRIDDAVAKGYVTAGFISYEAGLALVPHQKPRDAEGFPLIWMGIYKDIELLEGPLPLPPPPLEIPKIAMALDISEKEFKSGVESILEHIRSGETYQVNYTCRTRFFTSLSIFELYLQLRRSQPVPYGALLGCGPFSIISLSPELFLRKEGGSLWTRPMKGTAPRMTSREDDLQLSSWLANDPKNNAENLMIADLMRNDLGRIADCGSVEVFDPFRVENYRTLHQMTTGVRCSVPSNSSIQNIIAQTFPPGSITGAPKVRTMQLIGDLEKSPRKVYTGSICLFLPNGDFTMNVAIRTIIMDKDGSCEMGIGSGIVSDSDPGAEYEETLLKSHFLQSRTESKPELLETMLLQENGSILYLEDHFTRLGASASSFGYPFDSDRASKELTNWLGDKALTPVAVRLRLDSRGELNFELLPFVPWNPDRPARLMISPVLTDQEDILLSHKTTSRTVYDSELAGARRREAEDVIFFNNREHLTEGAISSIFIQTDQGWTTPSLDCGLLPGIWRKHYLDETNAAESLITLDDIPRAMRIVIGNSVRGAVDVAEVVDPDGTVVYKSQDP